MNGIYEGSMLIHKCKFIAEKKSERKKNWILIWLQNKDPTAIIYIIRIYNIRIQNTIWVNGQTKCRRESLIDFSFVVFQPSLEHGDGLLNPIRQYHISDVLVRFFFMAVSSVEISLPNKQWVVMMSANSVENRRI